MRIPTGIPGVVARDGGRNIENGLFEEWAVETEEVTGDHGLEDAMELRETLRFEGVLLLLFSEGTGGTSSERRNTDGRLDLTVCPFSSSSIRVELFHAGRLFNGELSIRCGSNFLIDGDESGVKL